MSWYPCLPFSSDPTWDTVTTNQDANRSAVLKKRADLSNFVAQSSSEGSHEFLNAYCRSSPLCSDIFAVLENSSRQQNPKELQLVFEALEAILLYTASLAKDASSGLAGAGALRAVGQTVVTKLLQYHMKMVYHSLNTSTPSFLVRSCLKLLIAVCTQGGDSTRQLCNVLDLGYKPLQLLSSRRDAKSADDIRSTFVKFCIALLVFGDADVIKTSLESNVLLSSLFKLLPSDRPAIIHLLFSTLRDKVLLNSAISKNVKVEFFNSNALLQVSKLCHRFRDSVSLPQTGEGEEPQRVTVANLAAELLHSVCCSSAKGIGFASKYSATGKSNNPVLLRFLTSLHTVGRNSLIEQLVVSTLSSFPDMLRSYWSGAAFSLEPRPTHLWVSNIAVAMKILEAQDCPHLGLVSSPQASEAITSAMAIFADGARIQSVCSDNSRIQPGSAIVSESSVPTALLSTIAPSSMTAAMFSHGVQHSNWHVKLGTLRLLALVLRRTNRFLAWCRDLVEADPKSLTASHSTRLPPAFVIQLAESVRNAIAQLLPNINVFMAARQKLISELGKTPDARVLHLDVSEDVEVPDVQASDLVLAALECMINYQQLIPSCFQQVGYDLCKLFIVPASDSAASSQNGFLLLPVSIQRCVLRLLLDMSASTGHWHKQVKELGTTPLRIILSSYVKALSRTRQEGDSDTDPQLVDLLSVAESLLVKLCLETDVVAETEVRLLLEAVRECFKDDCLDEFHSNVVDLLDDVICSLVGKASTASSLWSDFIASNSSETGSNGDSRQPVCTIDSILQSPMPLQRLTISHVKHREGLQSCSYFLVLTLAKLPNVTGGSHQCLLRILSVFIPLCVRQSDASQLVSQYVRDFVKTNLGEDHAAVGKKLRRIARDSLSMLPPSSSSLHTNRGVIEDEEMDVVDDTAAAKTPKSPHLKFRVGKDSWKSFAMQTLKSGFEQVEALEFLAALIPQIYQESSKTSKSRDQLPLDTLHQMIMSHSKFLETLLASTSTAATDTVEGESDALDSEQQLRTRRKGALVSLLLAVVRAGSKACSQAHVTFLLAAYSPILSEINMDLLTLLLLYERNSISLQGVRSSLWGEAAVAYLRDTSLHASSGGGALKSLWNDGCLDRVLQQLDRSMLLATAVNIPLEMKLIPSVDEESQFENPEVYDPRFLLLVFVQSLKPGLVVDCRRFVDSGALSFTLACMASLQDCLRSMAYLVIQFFCDHLESDHVFRDRWHVSWLLTTLKNAISEPSQRLSSIIAVFLGKAAVQLLHTEHWLYPILNRFFLQRPVLELSDVPLFYNLFNSTSIQYKKERSWMLQLLIDGLRHQSDLEIYKRRHVLELVMTFYLSSSCDNHSKELVCRLLRQGCKIDSCRRRLVTHHGLVPWLLHALRSACQMSSDQGHVLVLVELAKDILPAGKLSPSSALPSPVSPSHVGLRECHAILLQVAHDIV